MRARQHVPRRLDRTDADGTVAYGAGPGGGGPERLLTIFVLGFDLIGLVRNELEAHGVAEVRDSLGVRDGGGELALNGFSQRMKNIVNG